MILWLILAAFISGVALEAASPWVPVPGRKARVVRVKKIKKRHARKLKKKKRNHRRRRRVTTAIAPGRLAALQLNQQPAQLPRVEPT